MCAYEDIKECQAAAFSSLALSVMGFDHLTPEKSSFS